MVKVKMLSRLVFCESVKICCHSCEAMQDELLSFNYQRRHGVNQKPIKAWRITTFSFSYKMCSSRKYPYPHHGGNFTQTPPSFRKFPFLNTKITPPLHEYYVHPPYPLEKVVLARKSVKSGSKNSKHLAVCIARYCCLFAIDPNIWRYTQRKHTAIYLNML